MALSPAILINKSGKVVPVYDSNGAKKIGQLEKMRHMQGTEMKVV
ncbi:MAG: hypothetical protein ACLTYP_00195 [Eubacterium sp.]